MPGMKLKGRKLLKTENKNVEKALATVVREPCYTKGT
jgi:hypothetical protein